MPNEPSKDSSLFPSPTPSPSSEGEREDSGLQDILAVAAKIKDKPSDTDADSGGDSDGLIMFTAGEATDAPSDEDDALFGSFAGGLGLDMGADSLAGSSLVDEVSVSSASVGAAAAAPAAATATAAPPAEEQRNPLVAVAVVLGLALVGIGGVVLLDKGEKPQAQAQTQPEMSAPAQDTAAGAAVAEEPEPGPQDSTGAVAAPEPEPEIELADEAGELDPTEGFDSAGTGEDEGDPMGTREDLIEKKDSGIARAGKWDQGESAAKPEAKPDAVPDAKPDPEPMVEIPEVGGGGNKKVTEDDVDCLLNPDLPKCGQGSTAPKEQREVLAPKLPDKLGSKELRAGFTGIKPAAKKCAQQNGVPPGTKVKVHVSIEGASGKVTSVKALGDSAGTPLGTCVENAVKNAQFGQFKKPAMGIDYPIIM